MAGRGKDLYDYYIEKIRETLAKGKSFDVIERKIAIGGRDASIFFVDGLTEGNRMQWILAFLLNVDETRMKKVENADDFMKHVLPYLDSLVESDMNTIMKHLYSGLVPIVVSGLDKVVIVDTRDYPSRGVEEPSKEKSLRGAKDGFTEGFMTNIALVRRRIRDENLVIESHVIGRESKTDACIVYMKDVADSEIVKRLGERLDGIDEKSLGALDQTLVETILRGELKEGTGGYKAKTRIAHFFSWLNPFPKVRYTQRPDVVAAHVEEGKIAIILDNTPTVILLPACIFDFLQDVDDYYFPPLTGNYFRMVRVLNVLLTIFAIPLYYLMAEGYIPVHDAIRFFIPENDFAISLFWQFIIMEIAIDALKLASLNTPETLGTSLSVIGALILGEFSVSSGWFIPQTILVMAVVALASFTTPSIELGYATKFARLLILAGGAAGGEIGKMISDGSIVIFGLTADAICAVAGAAGALILVSIVMVCTKTLVGTSYLYPVIPFDGHALKKLIFRTAK